MKGLPWGEIYKEFKDKKLDPENLETRIAEMMMDDEMMMDEDWMIDEEMMEIQIID